MKMKRMEMRDVSIGEYQFKIRPFGAKDALYIFGDVASILLPILGSVAGAGEDKDAGGRCGFGHGILDESAGTH